LDLRDDGTANCIDAARRDDDDDDEQHEDEDEDVDEDEKRFEREEHKLARLVGQEDQ
jgi:hypothetical protein